MNLVDDALAEEELRRALSSGRPEAIAQTAMANIWPLYTGRFSLLIQAIEGLPSAVLDRYPVLRAVHRMTPVLASSTRPFKPLLYADASRAMSTDELDVLTLAQMVSFRFSGDVAAAVVYARRLQERLAQAPVESRERVDGPLWFYHHQIGSTLLAAGDSARALQELATARQLGRISGRRYAERIALGRMALAHAVRGSLDEAELALTRLAGLPEPSEAHASASAMTERAAAALIAVERLTDDTDDLLARLEAYDSIELSWPFALLARTRCLLARQRPDDALEAVRLASDAHPSQHGSFAADVIGAASIEAQLAAGDPAQARRLAELRDRSGVLTTLAATRVALEDSRLDVAEEAVRGLTADPALGPGHRLEALLFGAWAQTARTDELDGATARRIVRLVLGGDARRLLATMPSRLIVLARAEVESEDEGTAFDAATAELGHVELSRRPVLTPGELRVLGMLPATPTTRQIADDLHLSPNTVKSQLTSLYRKLGCSTRDDAMRIAARFQLLGATTEGRPE
ncbi:hypothetical protein IT072_17280 [Leifsonia sp. ZF2019]|uniref:LuxR family transcriptional regulator n=1 Tax=Leifsonia sp. ZF2019 TaxID=2781978 RepID=UPI001CBBB8B9|nr:LuxR family transcriptional regulator [Leifsonia sp. ZF2019]UAJ78945.1 hypothetical protein IT072_17280 [Leifsonia sp. ZF2019]